MGGVSRLQYSSSFVNDVGIGTVVDGGWREHAESRVVVVVVVPVKELCTVGQGFIIGRESIREIGLVFEGLELAFREWIVVRDVWTTMGFDDPQGCQQLSNSV